MLKLKLTPTNMLEHHTNMLGCEQHVCLEYYLKLWLPTCQHATNMSIKIVACAKSKRAIAPKSPKVEMLAIISKIYYFKISWSCIIHSGAAMNMVILVFEIGQTNY